VTSVCWRRARAGPGPPGAARAARPAGDDQDAEVAATALATIEGIPDESLAGFLARGDVTPEMRAYFARDGVQPSGVAASDDDALLVPVPADEALPADADERHRALSTLTVTDRMKLAMRGTREQRGALIHDSNPPGRGGGPEQPEAHRQRGGGVRAPWRTCRKRCCGSSARTATGSRTTRCSRPS